MEAQTRHDWKWRWWLLFLILFAVRLPFLLTQQTSDDAFIGYRTAFNLAEHGQYAFNLGQSSSAGVTSILFTHLVAVIRLIFRDQAVIALRVLGLLVSLTASWLAADALQPPGRNRTLLFVAIALLPISILVGYYAMEAFLVVLSAALGIYLLREGRVDWPFFLLVLVQPLIRPDSVSYGLILVGTAAFFNWRRALVALGMLGLGLILLATFNVLVVGTLMTTTITAKIVIYQIDHSVGAVLERLLEVYILPGNGFMLPVSTALLFWLAPLFALLGYGCAAFALYQAWPDRRRVILVGALVAMLTIPAAYAYGGMLMPWYFQPPKWVAWVLVAQAAINFRAKLATPGSRRIFTAALVLIWMALDALQFIVGVKQGLQEENYRAPIGKDIAAMAHPGDTLFLEPAGYIPFYSGLKTDDEAALVSRQVLNYRLKYGKSWLIRFVEDHHPTFIVERAHFLKWHTYSFARGDVYTFTPKEIAWFKAHYDLVRQYKFTLAVFTNSPIAHFAQTWFGIDSARLARGPLGRWLSHFDNQDDYYVYRYRSGS